jgi:hypothetical protein
VQKQKLVQNMLDGKVLVDFHAIFNEKYEQLTYFGNGAPNHWHPFWNRDMASLSLKAFSLYIKYT